MWGRWGGERGGEGVYGDDLAYSEVQAINLAQLNELLLCQAALVASSFMVRGGVACCVLRVACAVLRARCCVLRVACCVLRVAWETHTRTKPWRVSPIPRPHAAGPAVHPAPCARPGVETSTYIIHG